MENIQSITVIGRKWFGRTNGNTYHSVTVLVDGREVAFVPFEYGYDDHYIQTAAMLLDERGIIDRERYDNGSAQPLWNYCAKHGIAYHASATTVTRKRDL